MVGTLNPDLPGLDLPAQGGVKATPTVYLSELLKSNSGLFSFLLVVAFMSSLFPLGATLERRNPIKPGYFLIWLDLIWLD